MSAMEKSDLPEVARKRTNKAASAAAEPVERRGGAKENADLQSTVRTQSREAVSQAQTRIREAVTRNRKDELTALLHHINIDVLRTSFFGLKKTAAPGVDEMTWIEYAEHLEANLLDLHARVHTGAYRALPSLRKYIPKADGRQRPLGIAAMEDKIVQAAVVAILTPIYEAEFLGFSYGFRPKRSQHQALDALAFGIGQRRINWVLDCDVQSFFDKVNREWLIRFVEHLSRHQPDPGRKIATRAKNHGIRHRRGNRACPNDADARNALKPPARLVGAMLLHNPLIKRTEHGLCCLKLRCQHNHARPRITRQALIPIIRHDRQQ